MNITLAVILIGGLVLLRGILLYLEYRALKKRLNKEEALKRNLNREVILGRKLNSNIAAVNRTAMVEIKNYWVQYKNAKYTALKDLFDDK